MKSSMHIIGKKIWAFSAGHIPWLSNGKEPDFTSHDKIAILNISDVDAKIKITIFYEDENPVLDHEIKVSAKRVRKIRFNDLIDPLPIPLDKPFSFMATSDVEVIIQFSRMDTSSRQLAGFCATPFFQKIDNE
jgi:hypothetical protein